MENVLFGIVFVIVAIAIAVWRAGEGVRAVVRGETPQGLVGELGLATGDYGSMGLGAYDGAAGHAGGGCGTDGGGGGHC